MPESQSISGLYIEARNAVIEYYWMEGQTERLPMIATELARRPVSVIVAFSTAYPID